MKTQFVLLIGIYLISYLSIASSLLSYSYMTYWSKLSIQPVKVNSNHKVVDCQSNSAHGKFIQIIHDIQTLSDCKGYHFDSTIDELQAAFSNSVQEHSHHDQPEGSLIQRNNSGRKGKFNPAFELLPFTVAQLCVSNVG